MSDFSDELAAATTTASYIERNPEQKSRVYMIDILEHADRHTISLPDYVADHFKKCFDNGEITIKEANDVIDIFSAYNINKGYSWKHDFDEHVYSSDTEQFKAYITVSKDEVPLYTAICSNNGKETELCRSHEYTDCEKKIGEQFYNAALSDLSKKCNEQQIVNDLVTLADNHKAITIEDIIDRSRQLGLTLPKNQMEVMKISLENGSISGQEHMKNLDKIAEKLSDKGLRWATPESHAPNQPVHYLVDKYSTIQVYIVERTNHEKGTTFYAANRRSFDAEKKRDIFINMSTSNSVDSLKSNIASYYTGAAIRDVAKESVKNLAKESPEKKPQAPKAEPDYSLSR